MANLIDVNKWTIINGSRNGEEFVLVNGKMSQAITFPGDETKYRLEFNCGTLTDLKSYFLLKIVALEGKHTYLIPVMFLGENIIEMELIKDIKTISIVLVGSLSVSNIAIYENGVLTEEQKNSIDKVTNESDKWDRIDKVTNEQGNLITGRLEGSINNALNSIFGGNGTMEMIDGTIIFRDGATDATSTMAMRLNYGGLAIADSKKVDGSWDWKTFGTGQGFTADYLNAGTLSAITIDGVTITGTHIVGGTIEGAHISAGILDARQAQVIGLEVGSNITMGSNATIGWLQVQEKPDNLATTDQIPTIPSYITSTKITQTTIESPNISGSSINGGTITGATLLAGQKTGTNLIIDNTYEPLRLLYGDKKRITFYSISDAITKMRMFYGNENIGLEFDAGIDSEIRSPNGNLLMHVYGNLDLELYKALYMYEPRGGYTKRIFEVNAATKYINIGNSGTYTTIYGECRILEPTSRSMSELEVQNMELQQRLQDEGLARSELEVN